VHSHRDTGQGEDGSGVQDAAMVGGGLRGMQELGRGGEGTALHTRAHPVKPALNLHLLQKLCQQLERKLPHGDVRGAQQADDVVPKLAQAGGD
jgi:hypothetical protein